MRNDDVSVTLPVEMFVELLKDAQYVPEFLEKVNSLSRQVEGLHCLYRELMLKLAERN